MLRSDIDVFAILVTPEIASRYQSQAYNWSITSRQRQCHRNQPGKIGNFTRKESNVLNLNHIIF